MDNTPAFLLLALRIGMALALYGFLAWALRLVWQELQHAASHAASRPAPSIKLKFSGELKRYSLTQVVIGRDPACECYVDDTTVSSRHARLVFRQSQWWVEDLGSSNGTFINNSRVEIPTVLTEYDSIRCGSISFDISFGQEGSET